MQKSKNGFTMVELVFVIVILGILAAVAIPRFAATRTDADITKGRADIASIRSAIVTERQGRLIRGDSTWISKLSNSTTTLFTGVDANQTLLMYGITAKDASGHWQGQAGGLVHTFKLGTSTNTFTYTPTDGRFLCTSGSECSILTN
ncbi:prepilin-type N-terminal cleavage/methylation domain-containing protein [Candidatus Sulfurimonas baltica]|uniref:Prepilin-type N-terminal cleavage/methylation domain-containing protein n=1 Tax=Candidatus Sulfurimonas baltica TaxID=2740404 RepID=A0A7S7LUR7_9BACT|nr:prepilin-type N-terminal cleavage/methylation domain-containing protein [Candidatus Sulfurimonas baltica]QOY51670.1 prepilin-type N-terminal cleavage/methylation domain-containing protein [Candidatus Sulfurimonas baltica]